MNETGALTSELTVSSTAELSPDVMWAAGDLDRFATELIWELGPMLVDRCGVGPGQRVLDVAAGTGNVALRAAAAGATVVASDLVPAHFEAGRRHAASRGVTVEWREADAQALPFADASFDVVTSCLGAMFAPRHDRVARELTRVCRRGGTIGMVNFTREGLAGRFFEAFAPFMPALPGGAQPPLLWGDELHVRELLEPLTASLQITRHRYVERAHSPRAYSDFVMKTFGPAVAIREALAADPDRAGWFERAVLDFAECFNAGARGGPAEYPYEYLLVIAAR